MNVTDVFKLSAGARYEHVKQDPTAAGNDKFAGVADRDFNAFSASFGALYKLTHAWAVAGNIAYTEGARAGALRTVRQRTARRDRPVPDRQSGRAEGKSRLRRCVAALREWSEQGQHRRIL